MFGDRAIQEWVRKPSWLPLVETIPLGHIPRLSCSLGGSFTCVLPPDFHLCTTGLPAWLSLTITPYPPGYLYSDLLSWLLPLLGSRLLLWVRFLSGMAKVFIQGSLGAPIGPDLWPGGPDLSTGEALLLGLHYLLSGLPPMDT